jgi:hypothetical protein
MYHSLSRVSTHFLYKIANIFIMNISRIFLNVRYKVDLHYSKTDLLDITVNFVAIFAY